MQAPDWQAVERKWQKRWEEAKLFEAEPDARKQKCFVTFPFPYMSGPLHVGHGYTSVRVDVYARYKRMLGFNVLFPWAWHWTGETVAGASERIRLGDEKFIYALKVIDGVPDGELKKFIDPSYMAKYYTECNREAVKRLGLSVDWRREFHSTSICPTFNRFVEWQYKKLREGNYVTKGTHPVVWCPKCESPTGEADRLEGGGVSPEEYTLQKFKLDDAYLPAATFRPETIYGVTNLWVNPGGEYVEASVNGEKWIVSKTAAYKLGEQLREVRILRQLKGSELVGKSCRNPVGGGELPILPGWFVKPDDASGVVYSVPAHAPYDWLALRDLQRKPSLLEEFGITADRINRIKPIPIIRVEGFGDFPALELVDRLGAKGQNDPKAEEATRILYKKEFHLGVLKDNCGEYAGKTVAEVKQKLIEDFKRRGMADAMYDLPQRVVCRCTTQCIVKILQDQWFLHYSDPEWKSKAREALSRMQVYPPEAKNWFEAVFDWLHDWACSRKTGLGTPVPWAPEWVVETLSDSTVYTAFYTVNKHIRRGGITPEQLTDELFDYIFYGRGKLELLAKKTGLTVETINSMREEFLYWYPVDLRNSGKDLIPNHLTFYIFHHVALFPPQHWPRAVGVNGFMKVEGEEMHKSKGNFIPLLKAVKENGADVTRCTVILAAENMDDPDWRAESLREAGNNLNSLYRFVLELRGMEGKGNRSHLEKWLISMLQRRVAKVTSSIETLRTRTALENALYEVWNDIRWYLRRSEESHRPTLTEALSIWVRLLAPFLPHTSEELWVELGEKGFISTSPWPKYEEQKIDVKSEEVEQMIKNLCEDTRNILRATGITPMRVRYYTPARWKWDAYIRILEGQRAGAKTGELVRELMSSPNIRKMGSGAAKFIQKMVGDVGKMPADVLERKMEAGAIEDYEYLKKAGSFLEDEFKATVYVYREDEPEVYDPKCRAQQSEPYRPAIYIE